MIDTLDIKDSIADEFKNNLVHQFLHDDTEKYISGRNENSENLSTFVNVTGFIDNYTEEKEWLGKPIFKSSQINNKKAIVVSCSLAIYPHSTIGELRENGFINILNVLDVALYSNIELSIMFVSSAREDIKSNVKRYENIYNLIKEEDSKKIFKDLMSFRYNFDLSSTKNNIVDPIGQYFEDFLDFQDNEVFIDIGGYDGQTSIEFIKYCPKYKSVYIFEPSEENILLAKDNLKGYPNTNLISKGLSNKKEILKFNSGSGSASSMSEQGTVEIIVDTLDNLVKEEVSFIKMDIEGAEGLAIEGMKNHILNDHPKMAISVYHKVDDFWKIPEQIFAIRADYDIYMRHYTEGTDETVMFFIPNKI